MTPKKPLPMRTEPYFRRMEPFLLRAALGGSYWLPLEELAGVSPQSWCKYFREARRVFREYPGHLQSWGSLKHLVATPAAHGVHVRNKLKKTTVTIPDPTPIEPDEITMDWTLEQSKINECLAAGAANPIDFFYSKSYRIQCSNDQELSAALEYVRSNSAADAVADKSKLLILLA